jgi:signal transduction histidine kinase
MSRRASSWRPGKAYLAIGAALGLGAPLGFLALARLRLGGQPHRGWLARTLSSDRFAIAYMALSTPLVFGLFGRALGRHEEKLRVSAAHIERLREEFAAVVAHDLRNPIHCLMLQLDLLLRDARDGEVTVPVSTLRRLQRGGQRLGEMVNDLLDASRIEAARLSLQPQVLSVPAATAALVDRICPTLGSHRVDVQVEGSPPAVDVDPTRLDQILTNLIENAAKYSDEGTPISIRIRPRGSGVSLAVEDRGPGIPAEELPKLFDRFYQAKRAREKKSGLGLGLYITTGLVEAHGGRIEVESELGRGSTFSVWLPPASTPRGENSR